MIDFLEWLQNETRYKGMWRQFQQQHPDMPQSAAKDIYASRVSGPLRSLIQRRDDKLQAQASTQPLPVRQRRNQPSSPAPPETKEFAGRETPWARITPPGPNALDPDQETQSSPGGFRRSPSSDIPSDILSQIFQAQGLQGYKWEKTVINVDPSDFVEESLNNWISRHFGYKKYDVRQDIERTEFQRSQYSSPEGGPVANGKNEPVIVLRIGNKFKLLEGFHRTMWLLLAGAPQEQRTALQNLETDPSKYLNFSSWREVPIKAHVGTKPNAAEPVA